MVHHQKNQTNNQEGENKLFVKLVLWSKNVSKNFWHFGNKPNILRYQYNKMTQYNKYNKMDDNTKEIV